jgi:hypothetical protein
MLYETDVVKFTAEPIEFVFSSEPLEKLPRSIADRYDIHYTKVIPLSEDAQYFFDTDEVEQVTGFSPTDKGLVKAVRELVSTLGLTDTKYKSTNQMEVIQISANYYYWIEKDDEWWNYKFRMCNKRLVYYPISIHNDICEIKIEDRR